MTNTFTPHHPAALSRPQALSPAQRRLQLTGLVYTVMFLGAVQVFVFAPDELIRTFNLVSGLLFPALPVARDAGPFWVSMSASMMYCISALSIMLWRNPVRWADMAVPLVIAKFASSICGAGFFVAGLLRPETGWATLPNITIMLTDLPLGLWLAWAYLQVQREARRN